MNFFKSSVRCLLKFNDLLEFNDLKAINGVSNELKSQKIEKSKNTIRDFFLKVQRNLLSNLMTLKEVAKY